MKKYLSFVILVLIQMLVFYITPLFAGPTDMMGLIVLIIFFTFIISILMGIYKYKVKYIFPIIVAAAFIPSVFIYYNESAIVHALWYFSVSVVGILFGSFIKFIISLIKK